MYQRNLLLMALPVLVLALAGCGGGASITQEPPPPPPPPPPAPSFSIDVQAPTEVVEIEGGSQGESITIQPSNGFKGTVSVSLQGLPTGVTTTPAFPLQLAAGQTQYFTLQADATASAGTTTVQVVGMSGGQTKPSPFSLQLTPPAPFQISLNPASVSMTPGSTQTIVVTFSGTQIPSTLSLNYPSSSALENLGLNLTPLNGLGGPNQLEVLLTATALAQPQQNYPIFVSSGLGNESSQRTLSVTITSSEGTITSLNRSTAMRTDMGVTGAAYDATRKLVFATAWQLNEVLVFSSTDGTLKATIPVLLPLGIDESADGTKVYVGTFGPNIVLIDPDTLQVTSQVPGPPPGAGLNSIGCGPAKIVALANGKAVVLDECLLSESFGSTGTEAFLWEPTAGTFSSLTSANFSLPGSIGRSANRNKAFATGLAPRSAAILVYDTATDTSTVLTTSDGNTNFNSVAMNADGSQFAMADALSLGVSVYDGQLQFLTNVPLFNMSAVPVFFVYSLDGKTIYVVSGVDGLQCAVALDASTFALLGVAPSPIASGVPYAIDETGMIFEASDRGMAFLDASNPGAVKLPTPFLNALANPLLSITAPTQIMAGGLNFSASDTYQVYFGGAPASAGTPMGTGTTVNAQGFLVTTAPAGVTPGPANVTVTRPDGWMQIAPDGATFGPTILAVDANAGPPSGGSQIVIYGYGLNGPNTQVMIGGSAATISEAIGPGFISPFPYPMDAIYLVTPAGLPGPADVTITTPAGSTTMTGGFQYLASANAYPKGGALNQIVYDKGRQQLYVSNTSANEVEVFSLSSGKFLAPINVGNQPLGLALTPDGSLLAVANAGDGTVWAINPDSGTATAKYGALTASDAGAACAGQVWQIAPLGAHGMLVDVNCTALEQAGVIHTLDLSTGLLGTMKLPLGSGLDVFQSAPDGSVVALADAVGGVTLLNATTLGILQGGVAYADVAIDADVNRLVSGFTVYDNSLAFIGFPNEIDYLASGPNASTNLVGEKLNPSGSLLFVPQQTVQPAPHPLMEGVDIFDVHRQRRALRVALPDPLPGTMNEMALDETGTKMFLISNTGITVAQLQAAPLSIASVSPATGGVGTQVTIRGSGFASNTSVTIGTTPVNTVFVDQNTLQAVVPTLTPGPVRVSVSNPQGNPYSFDAAFVVQ